MSRKVYWLGLSLIIFLPTMYCMYASVFRRIITGHWQNTFTTGFSVWTKWRNDQYISYLRRYT